ncbi:hypothetical protein ACQ4PT_070285 [Festuca glaucescens]
MSGSLQAESGCTAVLRIQEPGPKPPVVIVHEWPSALRAHVVEVPAGCDVLLCVAAFVRHRRHGALVLGATGYVADVVLCKEPSPLKLWGTAMILGLAGCFFPPSASPAGVVVFLDRLQGAVLGGGLAEGGLVAAGPIVVMVAMFDQLPLLKGATEVDMG